MFWEENKPGEFGQRVLLVNGGKIKRKKFLQLTANQPTASTKSNTSYGSLNANFWVG
jgi:hypothetical protein